MAAAPPRPALAVLLALALASPAALADNDLTVRLVTGPGEATIGHDVTLQVALENSGSSALTGYKLGIFLSPDTALSVFDRKLGEVVGPDLAVGAKVTFSVTATIPATVTAGTYTLGIIGDPMNQLGEKVGTLLDNVRGLSPPTVVKAPSPDFVAVKVAWGLRAAGGEIIPVELTVDNRGVLDGHASVGLYLSTNETITRTDQLVGTLSIDVAAGAERDEVAWVKLPAGIAPARYFLGLWVDPNNEVVELNKTNNVAVSPPADLVSASLGVETTWLPDALVGVPYVKALVAGGGDGPYGWRLASGALPEGLALSAGGLLTGTAAAPGVYAPVFEVTSGSSTAQQALVLRAYPPTTTLQVATGALPPAVVDTDYAAPLAAAGGTGPFVWRLAQGALPTGLALAPDGVLKGRATKEDNQSFQVEVRDLSGATARKALALRSLRVGDLAIVQLVLDDATAQEAYTARLDPQGGSAPYGWELASGRLPRGLALASDGANSVALGGKALEAGTFRFAVRLEDATGQVDRNTYVLHVAPAAIKMLTPPLPDAQRGAAYDEELASDARAPVWRLASGELPPGLELTADGHVRATGGTVPATASLRTYTFLTEVTDGEGALGRQGLSITVVSEPKADEPVQGCRSAAAGLVALLPLALLARRRKGAAVLAVLLTAGVARAQSVADYFVVQAPEAAYPEPTSLWVDDVSLAVVTAGTAGANLVTNGDFADRNDDPAGGAGWNTQNGADLGAHAWLSCAYDAATGATAAPSLRCLYDFGQTAAPAAAQFQLLQKQLAVTAGDALEAHYCLKGTIGGQTATVALVDATGANLGLNRTFALDPAAFTCETRDFTALAAGPASLVVSLGDASAATHAIDFGSIDGSNFDDGETDVTVPFPFPMFGTGHQAGKIGTNGFLTFNGNADDYHNQTLPNSSPPNAVVAPWWDDLRLQKLPAGSAMPTSMVSWKVEGSAPARAFVAEWRGTTTSGGSSSELTFLARLGEDGSIEFHYRAPTGATSGYFTATVGVENDDGTIGVAVLPCQNHCVAADFPGGKVVRLVKQSELLVAGITGPALAHADLGAPFTLTLRNAGALPAAGVVGRVYLSADRDLDPAVDTLIWEVGPVALDRGQSKSFADNVHLPATLPPGAYYPIAVVDPDDVVVEADETNNVKIGEPIRLGAPAPDFAVTDVTLGATSAEAGGTVNVAASVKNLGNRAGTCPWRVVLSLNDVLSLADRTVAEGSFDLDAGAAEPLAAAVTLPADVAPGIYRVGVLLDAQEPPAAGTPEIDEFNNVGKAAQTLAISGPLAIVTTDLPAATAGATYAIRLQAAGGDGLYLWTMAGGTRLPAGLTLSPFGDIEGIPTTTGDATFTLQLLSNQTQTLTHAYTLHVGAANLVLSFVTTELPAAIFGREYEARLTATGGAPPYRFTVQASAQTSGLPSGLAFDPNGIIGGVPVSGGDFTLGVQVEDHAGHALARSLVLHVLPPGRPVIDARPLAQALLDQSYAATLSAIGGKAPYAWSLEKVRRIGSLGEATTELDKVPGLNLTGDGQLAGKPAELGIYALIVRVTDAGGAVDRDTLLLEVRADHGLAILTSELPTATLNKEYDEQVVAAGGADPVTFSLLDDGQLLPDGLLLQPDGKVQGQPTAIGRRTFVVEVTDGVGRIDYRALTLEVKSPPAPVETSTGCASGGAGGLALLGLVALFGGRRRRAFGAVAGALALGAALSACGTAPPRRLCAGVSCQPGEQCDPADGICKCGGVRACTSQESCTPQTLTCELLDRCLLVDCSRGMSCDPADGTCRCAGGSVCGEGESCDASAQKCVAADRCALASCGLGLACDPADGQCKCGGAGGVTCQPGERCDGARCKADPCASVACTGGESCDPADGQCRCGGAGGERCLYGQTCLPADHHCVASARCASVRCAGGTSCDPSDGQCKCGGAGGPTCSSGQTCDLGSLACLGGNRCFSKVCPTNAECDPEDGECHCGAAGPVCTADQSCDAGVTPRVCRTVCDPVAQTPCGTGEACSYSTTTKGAFCGIPGTKGEGAVCGASTECSRGLHCYTRLSSSGTCRYYCANPGGTCSGSTLTCRKLTGIDIGVCAP